MDQLTILAPARRHQSEVARFDADVVLMDSGSSTARPTPPAPPIPSESRSSETDRQAIIDGFHARQSAEVEATVNGTRGT
jgi:hypothetical protein